MSSASTSQSVIAWSVRSIPPFPPIAARLLTLLSNEFVSMPKLAEVIGSDTSFSGRLLQCVNSALFSLSYPVTDVLQALSILGLDRTRQLIATLVASVYSQGTLRTAELRRCWEHTVATAILADQIALGYGAFTDAAYAAGIMHDIGRLALLVAYPKEYERVIRDAAGQCLDLLDFEREHFGVDHAEAGRLLAQHWNLPKDFIVVAGRHHDPSEGSETDLLRIVHVACRLADALGYEFQQPIVPLEVDAVLAELPIQARSRLLATPEELRSLVESRIRAYEQTGEADKAAAPRGTESVEEETVAPKLSAVEAGAPRSQSVIAFAALLLVIAGLVALSLWR